MMRIPVLATLTLPLALSLSACTVKDLNPLDSGFWSDPDASATDIPRCETFTEESGANLGYGAYASNGAPNTDSSGVECTCSVEKTSTSTPISYFVSQTQLVAAGTQPKRVDVEAPFDAPAYRTPTGTAAGWQAQFRHTSSEAVDILGTYTVRQSQLDNADGFVSCSSYPATNIELDLTPAGPPPPPVDTDGEAEDDIACSAGEPLKTVFHLAHLPGQTSLVPLFASGDASFAGMEITAVRVLDWGEATELTLRTDAGEMLLDATTDEASLTEDSAWLWSTAFSVGAQQGFLPTIEVEGRCGSAAAPRLVAPGYLTTVGELAPWTDSGARVVARVVPDGRDDSEATHHLMFEVEGTSIAQGMPLVALGPDTWALDFQGEQMTLDATVKRSAAGLELDIQYGDLMGISDLTGRSLSLRPYTP